jgi:hypothetical protein
VSTPKGDLKRMSDYCRTITSEEWSLFVWMVDNCEKKQNNACKGCAMIETCINLYKNVSNICISNNQEAYREHENSLPTPGYPQMENHGEDIEAVYKRVRRGLRVTRRNGKVVA